MKKLILLFAILISFLIVSCNSNAVEANRDGVIADLNNLGAMAQQFYRKPVSMGGGGNTFYGWKIPQGVEKTSNGTYIATVNSQVVTIVGTGNEENEGNLIQHTATVTPNTITIIKNN